ncbi:MAG: hypothetical protein ACXVY8_08335 [Gaiellaceae bacterium]
MGFLDKAKAAAEQAAAKAKEGIEDAQTKRELGQTYNELGKAAFELIESGKLSDPTVDPLAAKIRELNEKLAAESMATDGNGAATSAEPAAESHDPSQPPAMPI